MTLSPVPASRVRPTCVVTVATDEDFRSSVRELIGTLPEVRLVGEAADGISAAILCALGQPETVIVDARLPWAEASDVLRHVRAASPDTGVIACTNTPDMGLAAVRLTVGPALATGVREELILALRRASAW